MNYTVYVPSATYENCSTDCLDTAWLWCLDLSEEFGYAEVRYGTCGPHPILGSYTNGQ